LGLGLVNVIALHSVLVEFHGGMLTLAVICIIATVVARSRVKLQKTNESLGSFWPGNSSSGRVARYTEPTAYLGEIGALFGIVASAIVGFFVWPLDLITTTSLGLSKVMFSVFTLELVAIVVFLRAKYGQNLWIKAGTATVYAFTAILSFILMVIAASFGGHMALKGSILDPLYAFIGLNPEKLGITTTNFWIITVIVSVVIIIVPLATFIYSHRRNPVKDESTSK